VSLLRRLRIAAPTQLGLFLPDVPLNPAQRWWSLPDRAQARALSLLARMIADGVVDIDEEVSSDADR
jgi:hypothetical protein